MNENTVDEISKIRDIINLYERSKSSSSTSTAAVQNQLKNLLCEVCSDSDTELEFNNYAREVYRLFYYRKHHLAFEMVKQYNLRLKTGVFKTSWYIVKYDCYVEPRQLLAYRALGFGINPEIKIVTPIWYYIFDSGYSGYRSGSSSAAINSVSDTDSDSDTTNTNTNTNEDGSAVKVNLDQLRTLEIQPVLPDSISLYKWYRTVHISMKDHDFIVTSIMLSVAKSIKYCHDKSLVHGDIKPDNILIVTGPADSATSTSFTMRRTAIPEAYLIDFGMCGRENIDTGTGGTRPYCAPETKNVNVATANRNSGSSMKKIQADEDDNYTWCKLTKAQDVWSLGLMLFTMISYSTLYYYYKDFPKRVFDSSSGYVRIIELADEPEIGAHVLYPVFAKTLCAPENRASIDEIIQLMTAALTSL
jgi:hypothetical protein